MSQSDINTCIVIGVAFGLIGITLGVPAGKIMGKLEMRREAVKEGVAHWTVNDEGETDFKWGRIEFGK